MSSTRSGPTRWLCWRAATAFRYPVAPRSTFDLARTYDQVVIEERSFDEVVKVKGRRVAPAGVAAFNPAFDRTPPELVSAIVTDLGVIRNPVAENLSSVVGR